MAKKERRTRDRSDVLTDLVQALSELNAALDAKEEAGKSGQATLKLAAQVHNLGVDIAAVGEEIQQAVLDVYGDRLVDVKEK